MRVITLLLLIGAAIAAPSANSPRIVGGTDADIRDYPYMAAIIANLVHLCSGSLITTRSVLTTAHCSLTMWRWNVRLGSNYWNHGGDVHSVESVVKHPGYKFPLWYNDVAIMKLATPAILSDRIALARIAGPNYVIPDQTTVTTLGYGHLFAEIPSSENLQQFDGLTINLDTCKEKYAELEQYRTPNITSEMVCARFLGVDGEDACGGSGGPLLHQGVIVGITSWGLECAHSIYPLVYTHVPSYTSWIVDNA